MNLFRSVFRWRTFPTNLKRAAPGCAEQSCQNFPNNILRGDECWCFPGTRLSQGQDSVGGWGQGTAAASPGAVLTHICHSWAIFHLRPPQRWQLILSTSQEAAHVSGKERVFPELWLGGNFCARLEHRGGKFAELGWGV